MRPTDLAEAWRLSGVSYAELVYRPVQRSGFAMKDSSSRKSVENALRGATINKMIYSLFTMGGAVFPFILFRLGFASISLAVAVSLSILLVFGYVVLYSIQVLPSFVTTGSFAPLTALPVSGPDTSLVAALTLWRTLDYVLGLSLVTQLVTVGYFTGSAVAALIVTVTSAAGSLLAVAAALWLTSVFQTRLEGGSMSGLRGLLRPLLFVAWGLGVMSAVFIFSLISYVAPPVEALLANPGAPLGAAASLIFPFSAGLLAASAVGQAISPETLLLSSVGVAIAVAGSVAASVGASRIINGVVLPGRDRLGGKRTADYSLTLRGPLSAYMLKDIRVSSRNPATGFLFALPVFEIVAVVVPLTATAVVRMSALLVGAQVGGGFALFIAFLLVTVEDLGVERRSALPLSEAVRALSKVMISTASYVPVPVALAVVLSSKASTFGGGFAIPIAALGSVFSACVVEVVVLKALTERGRGAAVRFAAGVGSGEVVLLLPAVLYTVEFVLSRSHVLSLELLAVCTVVEMAAAAALLRSMTDSGARRGEKGGQEAKDD